MAVNKARMEASDPEALTYISLMEQNGTDISTPAFEAEYNRITLPENRMELKRWIRNELARLQSSHQGPSAILAQARQASHPTDQAG